MRLALTVQIALSTAVGGLMAGLLALWVGSTTLSVGAGVAVRAVLVVLVLLLAPAIAVRRRLLDVDRAVLRRSALVGLLLGYLLDPLSWIGRAFVAQGVVPWDGVGSGRPRLNGVGMGAVLLATVRDPPRAARVRVGLTAGPSAHGPSCVERSSAAGLRCLERRSTRPRIMRNSANTRNGAPGVPASRRRRRPRRRPSGARHPRTSPQRPRRACRCWRVASSAALHIDGLRRRPSGAPTERSSVRDLSLLDASQSSRRQVGGRPAPHRVAVHAALPSPPGPGRRRLLDLDGAVPPNGPSPRSRRCRAGRRAVPRPAPRCRTSAPCARMLLPE